MCKAAKSFSLEFVISATALQNINFQQDTEKLLDETARVKSKSLESFSRTILHSDSHHLSPLPWEVPLSKNCKISSDTGYNNLRVGDLNLAHNIFCQNNYRLLGKLFLYCLDFFVQGCPLVICNHIHNILMATAGPSTLLLSCLE